MSEQKINNKKNNLISWIIFLPTLVIILFTLILGMFPALIIALSDKTRFPVEISAFEPGVWMFPILISNTIIFAIIILYRKNRLPQLLTNLFRSFLNFEISQRTSLVLIGVLISSYAILNAGGELYAPDPWEDFEAAVKEPLQNWSFDDKLSATTLKFFFGVLSMELFGSYRVIPFVASLVCLFLTYLVTVQISKKRFAGIVALAIVLQSENFLIYDTTITYPIFWTMFYLLSIYLLFKSSFLPPISYAASVLSHPIAAAFLPITIIAIVLFDFPKRKKILLVSSYFAFILIAFVLLLTQIISLPVTFTADSTSSIDFSRVLAAFASILTQFRYDGLIVIFLLPVVVCLFLASKKGISNANAILVLIGGLLLMIAFVPALTDMGNTPYRILSLVFFFAIGVGTLLSKNINLQDELLSKKL